MPSQHKGEPASRPGRGATDGPEDEAGGGQGRVRDPAHDGRLKANKARGISKGTTRKDETVAPGGQGRVKDPSRDRRLKKNQRQ